MKVECHKKVQKEHIKLMIMPKMVISRYKELQARLVSKVMDTNPVMLRRPLLRLVLATRLRKILRASVQVMLNIRA